MAAFKQFNTNQVVITPFYANKGFTFVGSSITASDVGIQYLQTKQGSYTSGSNPTGFSSSPRLDSVLVFNSIKQLYYSNYLTASTGDPISTGSLIPGVTPEYDSFIGNVTGPRYDNFLQTSATQSRYFAQFSSSLNRIGPSVISIPSKLFGEKIPCSTFNFSYTSSINYTKSFVHDDGEGNLIATQSDSSGNIVYTGSVGQIFYSQGMAILTGPDQGNLTKMASSVMNANGVGNNNLDSASIAFSSSITIRENQYKCAIRDNEYSYTTNPSSLKSSGQLSLDNNALSSSISTSTYGDNGNTGAFVLAYTSITGIGIGGLATVIVDAAGKVTNITTQTHGKGYEVGDEIQLVMDQPIPGGAGGQIILNATGIINFILIENNVSNVSSNLNQNETYYDFATGSDFTPYVTTVGLYNESYQLIAVGKMAQPIPVSLFTDTTFVVNFDT
jgi:hypothetical protein